jgi:signal peptidase I
VNDLSVETLSIFPSEIPNLIKTGTFRYDRGSLMLYDHKKKEKDQTPVVTRLILIAAGFLIGFLILRIFITPYRISDSSMEPNFQKGQLIFVLKHFSVKKNDAVLYRTPAGEDTVTLKRLIAIEGETVEVRSKIFYINGRQADFPWKTMQTDQRILAGAFTNRDLLPPVTLAKDDLFMAGDNPDMSFDSRDSGVVKKDRVIGKVIARF